MAEKLNVHASRLAKHPRQRERGLSLKLLIILEITVIRKPAERLSMQVRTMVRLTLREFPDYGLSVNIRKRCSFIHG